VFRSPLLSARDGVSVFVRGDVAGTVLANRPGAHFGILPLVPIVTHSGRKTPIECCGGCFLNVRLPIALDVSPGPNCVGFFGVSLPCCSL
jgi:hypothetical protein